MTDDNSDVVLFFVDGRWQDSYEISNAATNVADDHSVANQKISDTEEQEE